MCINSEELYLVPDHFKIEETCIKALKVGPWRVPGDVPDCFKTRDVCEKAMRKSPSLLMYVPDWFVTKQQIKMWRDDDEYCDDDDVLIEWYEGYQKQRAQKTQVEKELMPITWHSSC